MEENQREPVKEQVKQTCGMTIKSRKRSRKSKDGEEKGT